MIWIVQSLGNISKAWRAASIMAPHKTSGRTRMAIIRTGSGSSILLLLLLSILEELIGCSGVRGFIFVAEFDGILFAVAGVAGVAGTAIVNPIGVVAEVAMVDLAGVCNNRLKTGVDPNSDFLGVLFGDRDGVCCAAFRRLLSQTS